jgi:hypothetical protein
VSAAAVLAATCLLIAPFQVVDKDGLYRTTGASRCLRLFHGEAEATYLQLIPSPRRKPIDVFRAIDTTGFAWIDSDRIVFASSPIYGEGGLWLYSLKTRRVDEIGPAEKPDDLEYLWTQLVAVSKDTVTVRVGGREAFDETTAPQRTFRWVVRPRPLRPHD